MAKLISTVSEAKKNIEGFDTFIETETAMQALLPRHRAWYAIWTDDLGWAFGPSKVIGYKDITAEEYLEKGGDGRKTEAVLQKWFEEVGPDHPHHDELWSDLRDYLDEYGKAPSSAARINVLVEDETEDTGARREDAICDMIVEVARGLDDRHLKDVIKRLKTLTK